ncbi:AsnC family transcriptional regulator [Amylibacter marinus]|uniref:AsnC family transcriptional regulator n=1 Tax=Amylibacter marinus TaxID=1475483 RepID=A0ABQ5VYG6_9RHOB|nr:Lrp/AsnC family transcriptional regulator [Amylibacter marinus]GLQ36291.1 AsnC family transcriptional regulator [Amylibacter marinus]
MDDADRRILRAIQQNPDLTMRELGDVTGLSHTPCWRRLQRMKAEGIIGEKRYILNPETLGFDINVICFARMKEHSRGHLEEFETAVRNIPQVLQCYSVTGEYDFVLRVLAHSMRHYEETVKNALVRLPHVATLNTSVSLREVKNTPDLPI